MNGRFIEQETRAEYYVREFTNGVIRTIVWAGEDTHKPKSFTNVFIGSGIIFNRGVVGDLIEVPKGREARVFRNIPVTLSDDSIRFELPGVGARTLLKSDLTVPSNFAGEHGAGFYDEAPGSGSFSLTGVWRCDDGGTYYVRQVGNQVVWFGEHPRFGFSNVFFGESDGSRITGEWFDVPKGSAVGMGRLDLGITADPFFASTLALWEARDGVDGSDRVRFLKTLTSATQLAVVSSSGGFGGTVWNKTDSLRLAFRLEKLAILRNADVGNTLIHSGDEPYLMPAYFTIGGNQYTDPTKFSDVPAQIGSGPQVISPLLEHEWGRHGEWPKNNLTWQEDLFPGHTLRVPDFIAYGETELRTLPGFQPNAVTARDTATFTPGVIAMEEASTPLGGIRAGYDALLSSSPEVIHAALNRAMVSLSSSGAVPNIATLVAGVRATLTDIVIEAIRGSAGIIGAADPDKFMGAEFTPFSFGVLRDAALSDSPIPVEMIFHGGAAGEWKVTGTMSASLAPANELDTNFTKLEVTFETESGDNDKRGDSTVQIGVTDINGSVQLGEFPAHYPGQAFPGNTLHTTHMELNPPISLLQRGNLQVIWRQGPGHGTYHPDQWKLRKVRVVAFNRLNQRQVLLDNEGVNKVFDRDQLFEISLRG